MEISVNEIIQLKKIIFGQNTYFSKSKERYLFTLGCYEYTEIGNSDYIKLYIETIDRKNNSLDLRSINNLKLNNKTILLSNSDLETINISNSLIILNKIEFNHYLKIYTTCPEKYHPSFKSFKIFNKVFYISDREEEDAIHTITKDSYIKTLHKFHPIYYKLTNINKIEYKKDYKYVT